MKGIQDTSSNTFRQLMGNGLTYSIPKFQRDYSWEIEQWDDLWQDIQGVVNEPEKYHYMGYLVLQSADSKNFTVIDGQQRLITLSLIILTVLKQLRELETKDIEKENNQKRRETLHSSYIGFVNPVSLVSENKLKLNRNNDAFYRQHLTNLSKLPQRGLNSSEKLMRKCFEWFDQKISFLYSDGESFAKFVDTIVDKIFFTVIKVSDELNAFLVFETLNARGVKLSSADLLKNYLFSVVDRDGAHPTELSELDVLWGQVISKLGSEKFPEFLRIFWNSRNKTTRQNDLFKTIKKNIASKENAFKLIRNLNEKADIYIALLNPDDELWHHKEEVKKYLMELRLFGVKQPIPLLLTGYEVLSEDQFLILLKMCSVISFRYNIIGGLNPNEQEITYNLITLKIIDKKVFNKNDFKNIYPADESFETEFSNKSFKSTTRNHSLLRYILGKIEEITLSNAVDYESERFSIEHILPENPGQGWEHISNDMLERAIYRLGNLTLLEKKLNKEAGNQSFDVKKRIYEKSGINLSKKIVEDFTDWSEEQISRRQNWMAKQAKNIWKIN